MKHINIYFALISIVMLVLVGCNDNNTITKPFVESPQKIVTNDDASAIKMALPKIEVTYPLIVGKEMVVGSVSILNDKDYFYVIYNTMKDWTIKETSLSFGSELKEIPMNEENVPLIDKFAYSQMHNAYAKVSYYKIPIGETKLMTGQEIFFAAYALLRNDASNSTKQPLEMAWGGVDRGPGQEWWNYIIYNFDLNFKDGGLVKEDSKIFENKSEVIYQ